MLSAVDCLCLPNNADFVSSSCASGQILRMCETDFFTNEIIFATITSPLHDSFYSRRRGSLRTGQFARNGGDGRRPPLGGRPLHPAKTQRRDFEKISADVSGDARF